MRTDKLYSTECYGVDSCADGGYVVACGTGPEISQGSEPWQNLVQRVDRNGTSLWKHIYVGTHGRNGTGEFVVSDRAYGGYAVYMDTQNWGDGGTGLWRTSFTVCTTIPAFPPSFSSSFRLYASRCAYGAVGAAGSASWDLTEFR